MTSKANKLNLRRLLLKVSVSLSLMSKNSERTLKRTVQQFQELSQEKLWIDWKCSLMSATFERGNMTLIMQVKNYLDYLINPTLSWMKLRNKSSYLTSFITCTLKLRTHSPNGERFNGLKFRMKLEKWLNKLKYLVVTASSFLEFLNLGKHTKNSSKKLMIWLR